MNHKLAQIHDKLDKHNIVHICTMFINDGGIKKYSDVGICSCMRDMYMSVVYVNTGKAGVPHPFGSLGWVIGKDGYAAPEWREALRSICEHFPGIKDYTMQTIASKIRDTIKMQPDRQLIYTWEEADAYLKDRNIKISACESGSDYRLVCVHPRR